MTFKIGDKIMWTWGNLHRAIIVDISKRFYIVADNFNGRAVHEHEYQAVLKNTRHLERYDEKEFWDWHREAESHDPMG
jgi:hypothetical protein